MIASSDALSPIPINTRRHQRTPSSALIKSGSTAQQLRTTLYTQGDPTMNITKTEALILEQLVAAAGSELYGLQMVKDSGGALKMGSIYVILGRLEDKGFVESRKETEPQQTVPRRLYKVTGAGSTIYRAWAAGMAAFHRGLLGV